MHAGLASTQLQSATRNKPSADGVRVSAQHWHEYDLALEYSHTHQDMLARWVAKVFYFSRQA